MAPIRRNLETWPRRGDGIDWGCDRDLPVLARNNKVALVYHPPGKRWVCLHEPHERTHASLKLHSLKDPLMSRELALPLKGGQRRLGPVAIEAHQAVIDAAFGHGASILIAESIDPRWRRPLFTIVFAKSQAGVLVDLVEIVAGVKIPVIAG